MLTSHRPQNEQFRNAKCEYFFWVVLRIVILVSLDAFVLPRGESFSPFAILPVFIAVKNDPVSVCVELLAGNISIAAKGHKGVCTVSQDKGETNFSSLD